MRSLVHTPSHRMLLVYWSCLLCLFSFIRLSGQDNCPGYDKAFEAEILYRSTGDLQGAVPLYQASFSAGIKDPSRVLDAITCATGAGDTSAVLYFMTYGLELGLRVSDYRNLWTHLGHGMDLVPFMANVDTTKAIEIYQSRLNNVLIDTLAACAGRDQQYRSGDTMDWKYQRFNDSINWITLKNLTIGARKLPGYSVLGMEASEDLKLLFYHMDKDVLAWFLPYVIEAIHQYECNLGEVILYQLDRIGMDEGVLYTVSNDYQIRKYARRTRMKNNMWCQSFGQWFDEQDLEGGQAYFTPLDPRLPVEEINRVRRLFCLDPIESKWQRKPWARVISIKEFEQIFRM